MVPFRGHVLLALLCLYCMTKTTVSVVVQCEQPSNWPDNMGPNPVTSRRGNVVLVAMLKGYCSFCIEQARRLYQLKNRLEDEGYPDIEMVIINGGERPSRTRIHRLTNASPIPVIQDSRDHHLYRRVFVSNKDDFMVYDRCGQAVYYIPVQYSDLRVNITEIVLKSVHDGNHPCYCALDNEENTSQDDMMAGDDPNVMQHSDMLPPDSNYVPEIRTPSLGWDSGFMECPPSDSVCQQFRRLMSSSEYGNRIRGNIWRGALDAGQRYGMGRGGGGGQGFETGVLSHGGPSEQEGRGRISMHRRTRGPRIRGRQLRHGYSTYRHGGSGRSLPYDNFESIRFGTANRHGGSS